MAIGCANHSFIMENAVYYVASPEACAAILWKSRDKVAAVCHSYHCETRDCMVPAELYTHTSTLSFPTERRVIFGAVMQSVNTGCKYDISLICRLLRLCALLRKSSSILGSWMPSLRSHWVVRILSPWDHSQPSRKLSWTSTRPSMPLTLLLLNPWACSHQAATPSVYPVLSESFPRKRLARSLMITVAGT